MDFSKAIFIREFETMLLALFAQGKLNGTVHTCVGQETIPLAIAPFTIKGDMVFSNHRGHGHFLAFGGSSKFLLAEVLGKKCGVSGGIGGSQHLYADNFISNGIQAGLTPAAVGYAYVNKLKENKNISLVFVGDGTLGEGLLYESLNMAAIYEVPVLFVLENNGYAQSTPFAMIKRGELRQRIEGFGVSYVNTSIWSDDLESVAEEAVNACRSGKPVFLEIGCYRLNSHSKGDDNRAPAEIKMYHEKDPIHRFELEFPVDAEAFRTEAKIRLTAELEEVDLAEDLKSMPRHEYIYYQPVKWSALQDSQPHRINKLINLSLSRLLDNPASLMLGEDIMDTTPYTPGMYGGAFKVSAGLSSRFPGRVINTPIAEASVVGFALGAALNGYRAVSEIMFGDFLSLGFDQLLQQVSKIPEMYGRKISLPMIIRTPMGGRRGYGPTHSQNIEKHFMFLPNIRMLALNTFVNPVKIFECIESAEDQPVILIEDKIGYTRQLFDFHIRGYKVFQSDEEFPTLIFRPEAIRPNVTIFCYGGMADEVTAALEEMLVEDVYPEIICPVSLSPLNIYPLTESIRSTDRLCIVEEGSKFGAISSEILAYILTHKIQLDKVFRWSNESIIPCSRKGEQTVIPNRNNILSKIVKFVHD
ncbi:MAG: hypothetical protein J5I59_02015 [Saprospiraceae bacterium]|nr:hypothetical protein [Saprospiraceae bacterium]